MDRLLSLRNSEANSSCNSSQLSELGYETARDESCCSMYYSMDDDDTVTSIDDDELNISGHSQLAIVPSTKSTSSHGNDNISTFVETGRFPQSSVTVPIPSKENLDGPIVSANSNVAMQIVSDTENFNLPTESSSSSLMTKYTSFVEAERSTVPIESSEISENSNVPSQSTNALITNPPLVENSLQPFGCSVIPNLPSLPEVSTLMRNGTNYNTSSTVQEMYVVAVNTQQTTSGAPRQTRATRSTIVRFQSDDLPRRQTVFPRRTLRDTRNEVMPSNRPVVTAGPSNVGRKSVVSTNHVCDVCKMVFPLRSTLIVHKTSHNTKCKYCDRSFKKSIALSNHLKENCEKIPAAARRKILSNEYKEKMMTA